MDLIKIKAPPIAWVKKYLMEDSLWFISDEDNIRGIIDRRLISSPTQRKIHWLDIKVIIEPKNNVTENRKM